MKRILFILLCLFGPSLSFGAESVRLSFEDLPRLVEAQNLEVQGAKSFLHAADARTKYLHRSFLPDISAYGGAEVSQQSTVGRKTEPIAGAEANINLLRGGRDYLEENIRQEETALQSYHYKKNTLQELTRARDLFINVLFLEELITNYHQALRRNKENLAMVQTKIDAGLTTETDKLDFEINQIQLNQELAILKEDHEHSLELLRAVLGLDTNTKLTLQGRLTHAEKEAQVKAAFDPSQHHDVSILEKQKNIAKIEKNKAQLWWTPSVDIYANYKLQPFREREQNLLRDRDEAVAGIQMSLNLFDGLKSHNEAKSLRYQSKGYEQQAQQKARELEVQFSALQHRLKLRHDLIHSIQKSVRQGREYLNRTRDEYRLGTKNSPDVLSASQRILDLSRRYATIQRDFLVTRNDVFAILGE
jgi:outer membrane protein TolC